MGLFTWPFEIGNLNGGPFERVEGLVDTGATYCSVPGNILRGLGVEPTETLEFEMADGRIIERQLGDVRARVEGKEVLTTVIFGEEGDSVLLGVYTLERAHLGVDPFDRRIVPVRPRLGQNGHYPFSNGAC